MASRRTLLSTIGATGIAGLSGCLGRLDGLLDGGPAVEGLCPDPSATWPTAGGDAGRTGRTDTEPPGPDADVVDLLAGVAPDGGPRLASSLPAVAEGTAYVPSAGGVVAVDLDAPTGDPSWRQDLEDDVDSVPALACGAVLAAGLNRVAALDPRTGEARWRVDAGGHHPTALAPVDDRTLAAGVTVAAIDIRSGDVCWTARGGDTLAADDGGVYTTRNVNGTGGIYAHDHDGEMRWHLALGKIVGSATVLDGTVWVADNDGTVYAIDAATGETHWSTRLAGVDKVHSGLAVRGDDLVVPAGVGATSVVLDPVTGAVRHTIDTGIVTGRPVVGSDWIALGRTNVGVTVYDRTGGEPQVTWTREDHGLGTIAGLVPVEGGFVVRGGPTSGLSLIR